MLCLVLNTISSFAQKKILIEDSDAIIEAATRELDSAMQGPEGTLYLFAQNTPIRGVYTLDISIREKGQVSSLYIVGNEGGSIEFQNKLRSFMMDYIFHFKMPKGKIYKFRYTFHFK